VICQSQKEDPHQIAEFEAFVASCRPQMVLFDIGAHFGIFSLAALHYGGPTARAIPIDPSPVACRIMKIQAAMNYSAGRLCPMQTCVGDRQGWKDMLDVGVLSGGYYIAAPSDYPRKDRIRIRQITVDSLADELKVLPTHVKIDVEGSEGEVLTGMRDVLSRASPLLFLELHNKIVRGRNEDPSDAVSIIRTFGYQMFSLFNGNSLRDAEILNDPLIRVIARKEP
jgi:FkbM family methyltransferase